MDLDDLLRDPPLVHEGGATTWGLDPRVLRFIDERVTPNHVTLETGVGLSTIAFAMRGSQHHVVVPAQDEGERVAAYCRSKGISLHSVSFHFGPSELLLPRLEIPELDFVLIDGCHGFPSPFIDWFYTANLLRLGGHVLIDDVQIWTCHLLAKFLDRQPGWDRQKRLAPRTEMFRKTQPFEPAEWAQQPLVVACSRPTIAWYRLRRGLEFAREKRWIDIAKRLAPKR